MLKIIFPDGTQTGEPVSQGIIWTFIIISLAVTLAFYALRSVGLYVMAKKRELKHAFIAFIPLAWIYTACKLVGKVRIFGSTFEKLALLACIIFSVGQVLSFFYDFIIYFPVIGNFLAGHELCMVLVTDSELIDTYTQGLTTIWGNFSIYGGTGYVDPYERMGIYAETLNPVLTATYYTSMVFDLATIIITVTLYINLFRKYYPQHFILFAVLSWMGIFAPLVFAVRNRQPMDYNDYLKSRYNAWYAGGNPYGGHINQNPTPQTPPTPFEEFAEKDEIDPGDPFANFNRPTSGNDKDKDDFFN